MHILLTIVVGFAAGAAARFIMPGKEPGGLILTTLLGIGGAFVGRFLGGIIGLYATSLFGEIVSATLGAILILFVYNKFRK